MLQKKKKRLGLLTNRQKLMTIGTLVRISQPYDRLNGHGWEGRITEPRTGLGAINYTMKLKDNVFKYAGDHSEPYVSAIGQVLNDDDSEFNRTTVFENICIGNEAMISDVESADRWRKGWVVGKHGGCEHIIIYFTDKYLEKTFPYMEIIVKAYGQGLKLLDFPEIKIMNIDPRVFENIGLKIMKGKVLVPVAAKVPGKLMGSGLGTVDSYGDYDIMNSDMTEIRKLDLHKLKIGDLVAIIDQYSAFGYTYYKGAISIGVIIHGSCMESGHGAGVCTIMTTKENKIEPVIFRKSNIEDYHIF